MHPTSFYYAIVLPLSVWDIIGGTISEGVQVSDICVLQKNKKGQNNCENGAHEMISYFGDNLYPDAVTPVV